MLDGPPDIGRLPSFVAAAQQQNTRASSQCVIDPITRAPIDPQFGDSFAQRLAIPKVAESQTIDSDGDSGAGVCLQSCEPFPNNIFPRPADVAAYFDLMHHCNL